MSTATKYYNGTTDIGTYFCDLTNDQTVKGTKTFETTPVIGTKASDNNTTSAASTAFVTTAVSTLSTSVATTYAPKASPTFTGTVTVPAPTANSTNAATTAFVKSAIDAIPAPNLSSYAPLASPTFTGNVIIGTTTSTSGGNIHLTSYSTGITGCNIHFIDSANTVKSRIFTTALGIYIDSDSFIFRNFLGTSLITTNTTGTSFTGTVTVPAPTDGNSTQVATTAWVKSVLPASTTVDLSSYATKSYVATTLGVYNPFGIDYQSVTTNPSIALANDSVNLYWFTNGSASSFGLVAVGDGGICNHFPMSTSGGGTVSTSTNNVSYSSNARYRVIRLI